MTETKELNRLLVGSLFTLSILLGLLSGSRIFAEDFEECEEKVEKHKDYQLKSFTCGSDGLFRIHKGSRVIFETKKVFAKDYALHPSLDEVYFESRPDQKHPSTIQKFDLKSAKISQAIKGESLAFIKSNSEENQLAASSKDVLALISRGQKKLSAVYTINLKSPQEPIKQIPLKIHIKRAPIIESVIVLQPETPSNEVTALSINETGMQPISVFVSDKKSASVYTLSDEAEIEGLGFDADCKAIYFVEVNLSEEERITSLKPVVMVSGKAPMIAPEIRVDDAESVGARRLQRGKAQITWTETKMMSKVKKSKLVDFRSLCKTG